jgi:hypothetical protein
MDQAMRRERDVSDINHDGNNDRNDDDSNRSKEELRKGW